MSVLNFWALSVAPQDTLFLKKTKFLDLHVNLSYILNIDDLLKNTKTVGSEANTSGGQMWL